LDLLKEKITDGLSVIWSLDELKLMLTEGAPVSSKSVLFLTEYHKVEVLK
jgi:hypothetical protein